MIMSRPTMTSFTHSPFRGKIERPPFVEPATTFVPLVIVNALLRPAKIDDRVPWIAGLAIDSGKFGNKRLRAEAGYGECPPLRFFPLRAQQSCRHPLLSTVCAR